MSKTKRPHIKRVIADARKHSLFVLSYDNSYEFFDKKTGKKVLVYYLNTGRWVMPGAADRSGISASYRDALALL